MSSFTLDGVTTATPLNVMKTAWKAGESNLGVDLMAMFIGKIPGTIGEVSVVALLIGAAYLVFKKVISLRIPLTYIVTVAVFVFIFGRQDLNFVLAHICGGGLIFGAFFMATDYVNQPDHPEGTDRIWYSAWRADRNIPSVRWFRRGCFLRNHHQQPDGSAD